MPHEQLEPLRLLMLCLPALPAVAAAVVALLGPGRAAQVRLVSLAATLACLVSAVVLAVVFYNYDRTDPAGFPKDRAASFRPEIVPGAPTTIHGETDARGKKLPDVENRHATTWTLVRFGDAGAIQLYFGLDGLNVWLVVLTALLMVSGVLASWSITDRVNEYFAWLLLLGTAMFGVFLAFDIILFYVFFELTLVPLFFLIGIWGGPERRHAARKFFVYTLAGSLVTLLGVLAVVLVCYHLHPSHVLTFSIPELVRLMGQLHADPAHRDFLQAFQFWVFLALIAGFAIKVPLFPVHTWLPLAHVEAPTAGSVLLAGVLLKVGAYGFLRLCLPLVPDACFSVGVPLIGTLSVVGIIYGAFCSLAQDDMKKLVAYSSVSHLGFCMLGMFALNEAGLTGSLLQMVNHGLSTGGLFLLVGMLYERYHTRKLSDYGGMSARLGVLGFCMVVVCLSSVGLPGLNGFVGEALVFFGMFQVRPDLAVLGTTGIVLGAWYLLTLLRRVFFGPVKEPAHDGHAVGDMNGREWAALGPILALIVLLGVWPQPVISTAAPDVRVVADILKARDPDTASAPTQPNANTAVVDAGGREGP
jgi:NADH-quinone oxidoreductase subunit M